MSDELTTLILDRYQRDNLLALLHLVYRMREGAGLNTGDWCGEIYWMLARGGFDKNVHRPNIPVEDMAATHVAMIESSRKPQRP